ncbi:MAG: hypothetical protein V7719_17855 [Psychroserpens sp.]|uniref:hypothetical protein n=1 Tax=Psychroserpens sp. TaxID=2020870 RepID=UPI003003638F
MLIKNVIVNNGIKEYNSDEINYDKTIYNLANSVIKWNVIESFADKINSENGIFYINCDSDFSKGSGTLKNVSTELLNEWNQSRF